VPPVGLRRPQLDLLLLSLCMSFFSDPKLETEQEL